MPLKVLENTPYRQLKERVDNPDNVPGFVCELLRYLVKEKLHDYSIVPQLDGASLPSDWFNYVTAVAIQNMEVYTKNFAWVYVAFPKATVYAYDAQSLRIGPDPLG
jgi:hypothetical protein